MRWTRDGTELRRSTTSPSRVPTISWKCVRIVEWVGFNAADYFTNATAGNHKPRSTVNHFGGSLGGPIVRDKVFFFFDSEWVRIALPIVSPTTVPTRRFRITFCSNLPLGGTDSVTGQDISGASADSVPFYQKMFSLYGNTSGTPLAVLGCPFDVGGICAGDSPMMETVARIAKAFRIRATITSRCRRCASTTT